MRTDAYSDILVNLQLASDKWTVWRGESRATYSAERSLANGGYVAIFCPWLFGTVTIGTHVNVFNLSIRQNLALRRCIKSLYRYRVDCDEQRLVASVESIFEKEMHQ